jgi:hypothetical protein
MKVFKIIAINAVLLFFLGEIVLRIWWPNPYVLPEEKVYLHHPLQRIEFHNLDALYASAPDPVVFSTSDEGYIDSKAARAFRENGKKDRFAIALGGSTTESLVVRENKRWPDLLDIVTLNFGKSRMYSYNTYYSLRYLLVERAMKPTYVFVMDGINNMSRYIGYGAQAFDVHGYEYRLTGPVIDFVMENCYLAAFLWRLPKYSNMVHFYRYLVRRNMRNPPMNEESFHVWLADNREPMRKTMLTVFGELAALAREHGTKLIVLTQPHAYVDDYRVHGDLDLRVYPVIDGRRLSVAESRELMDEFNSITLEVARDLGLWNIDVASCLSRFDSSEMIYDAWHFTEAGSAQVARCINSDLRRLSLK